MNEEIKAIELKNGMLEQVSGGATNPDTEEGYQIWMGLLDEIEAKIKEEQRNLSPSDSMKRSNLSTAEAALYSCRRECKMLSNMGYSGQKLWEALTPPGKCKLRGLQQLYLPDPDASGVRDGINTCVNG